MPLPTDETRLSTARDVLQSFDAVNGGVHPGFRPAHAKGQLMAGSFVPAPEGAEFSAAPHFHAPSTPVIARFSDSTGIPNIPDNDPNASGPRGFAIRFQLGEHRHTDIVLHSTDGFPVRTAPEMAGLLGAIHATTADSPHPSPIEQFLGGHPKALAFVQTPKPIPSSFARESFFGVNAFILVNTAGIQRHIRYRIVPEAGRDHLNAAAAAARGPNFLFEELAARLAAGPIVMQLWAQLAGESDILDDATEHWSEDRPQVLLGIVTLTGLVPNDDSEGKRIIFDPIPRVEGILPSADPLLEARADVYLMSGRGGRPLISRPGRLLVPDKILHLAIGPEEDQRHAGVARPVRRAAVEPILPDIALGSVDDAQGIPIKPAHIPLRHSHVDRMRARLRAGIGSRGRTAVVGPGIIGGATGKQHSQSQGKKEYSHGGCAEHYLVSIARRQTKSYRLPD
jgi:catalase